MIITVILVLCGFLSLAAVLYLAKDREVIPVDLPALRKKIKTLDVQAFRNLIDADDDDFLRRSLDASDFRTVRQLRLLAAIDYLRCASDNAAILHQFGEAARHSPNAAVAIAGENLANSALRFRLNALYGIFWLCLVLIIPALGTRRLSVAEAYERMSTLVVLLNCMQFGRQAA